MIKSLYYDKMIKFLYYDKMQESYDLHICSSTAYLIICIIGK